MTSRAVVVLSAMLTVALAAASAPQQPQTPRDVRPAARTGTAVLAGTVTADEPNGRPVRRVTVQLTSDDAISTWTTATDDLGRFVLPALPAGSFRLSLQKAGWVGGWYGATRPLGTGSAIALREDERLTIAASILRGAVISGRIVDHNGRPATGLVLQLGEIRNIAGERLLYSVRAGGDALVTNDRGEYRLYGLPPGAYAISATVSQGLASLARTFRPMSPAELQWALQSGSAPAARAPAVAPARPLAYATVYFPGTTDVTAAGLIRLSAGEERSGIDFALLPVPLARVEGTLMRQDGQPAQGAPLELFRLDGDRFNNFEVYGGRAVADAAGRFLFATVKPGRWVVNARSAGKADTWARAELSVNGDDIRDLRLTLEPGVTMSGRVVFDATTLVPPKDFARVQVQLGPANSWAPNSRSMLYFSPVAADGTFVTQGIAPGRYVISASSGGGWTERSIVMNGQNAMDTPFEIRANQNTTDVVVTMTDRIAEISGTLLDAAGRPAPGYFVFAFSTDRSFWGLGTRRVPPAVRPSNDGRFRLTRLPPGEYYLAALTDMDEMDRYDATFIEQLLPQALKITLAEGQRLTQDLKLQGR